ncbi:OprD family outer membrane porin [Pseudomonas sp. S2_A02]
MQIKLLSTLLCAIPCALSFSVAASNQSDSKGFVDDSSASLLFRNAYFVRNYEDNTNDVKVWGQGFIGNFQSGFTQGTVGLGADAYVLSGVKLDSGRGRNFSEFFDTDSDGRPVDELFEAGAAVKLRVSNTILKHGTQFPLLPILTYSDIRLLPQAFTGTSIISKEIPGLELNAGHFTAESETGEPARDSARLRSTEFLGGRYSVNEQLSFMLYHSDVESQYNKWYTNGKWVMQLSPHELLTLDFSMYRTKYDDGAVSAIVMGGDGKNNRNTIWSLAAIYGVGPHTFQLSQQRNSGDTGYAYDFGDGGALWVANSLYSDFNLNNERSWVASYGYSFSEFGLPGLTYKFAYGYGSNIAADNSSDRTEREIFNQVKYVVQDGRFKDLSLRLRNSFYRTDNEVGPDMNEIRMFIEYPIRLL